MRNWKFAGGVAAAAFTAAIVAPAEAQVTTSAVRGTVTDAGGAPVSGASVVISDSRTGFTRDLTTTAGGNFTARGMNVGGPYTVEVSADGYQSVRRESVFLQLGETADLSLSFPEVTADSRTLDAVVITASAGDLIQTAIGPSSTFDLANLQNTPAINRDLRDIIRQDPRIFLDEGNNDAVQCAGANPRFNSLTVDGIGLNDGFGLNSNGYPGQQMPFPFDAIENVAVELAPFDVQYNGFTGCNINAVTKSGSNEFSGSLFYDYTDDSLVGDKTEGDDVTIDPFEEKRFGGTIGGPIIKDRVFFFGAYEKFEGPGATIDRGVEGSGAGTEVEGFTQEDFDRIRDISINQYDYDPGGVPTSQETFNEKYLMRLDINITDNHRAAITYNYDEGVALVESDGDADEFEYSNHLYNRGGELKATSAQIFSDWTESFSTELRISKNEVDFTQQSVDDAVFGEVQIRDDGNTIYLGSDDSRHANDLNYDVWIYKGVGNYQAGDHLLTVGAERVEYDVFNLFIQEAEGEYRFDSIDDFEAGTPSRITYENATGTNDINDGAASFTYEINTFYLQDEWEVGNGLTLTAGLRYDLYTTGDEPTFNQNFSDTYGFSNTATLDGEGLLMPRVAFNWDQSDRLNVRGGFGLYSGGNPNVWLSNNYSNNGATLFESQDRSGTSVFDLTFVNDEEGLGRPIYGIPEDQFNEVAEADADGPVNALDPNFRIPSEWKASLGATLFFDAPYNLGTDYMLTADWLFSSTQDGATVKGISLTQTGTAPDGRPIYSGSAGFGGDILLTNQDGGQSNVISAALSKTYDDWGVDWTIGYAFMDAEDANPMTSSTAASNFFNVARTDPNNLDTATSNYEIPHRWTARVSWERAFFGDFLTKATLFGQAFQGRPYSFTFDGGSSEFTVGGVTTEDLDDDLFGDDAVGSHLLYVPTGVNDPNVIFADTFDTAAFFEYVDSYGLARGQITERNAQEGTWSNKFDVRVEQEFPTGGFGRAAAYVIVENIGNLLNDEWGSYRQAGFPQTVGIVEAAIDPVSGRYVYTNFIDADPERRETRQSLWELRMGLRYEF